jgi:hypothetical protein
MFPRLSQRISSAVLDRLDLVVELSTLGEYGLAEDGLPLALTPADGSAPHDRNRDDCPFRARPAATRSARGSCPR